MKKSETIQILRDRISAELYGNILPFWRKYAVDEADGGFIAWMSHDLHIDRNAPKGLILNTRMLWSFAAVAAVTGAQEDIEIAGRAYRYLDEFFRDDQHGGVFWYVDRYGKVIDARKKIYGHAFYIYALAQYYLLTRQQSALDKAVALFDLLEKYSHDDEYQGYFETFAPDWQMTGDMRLSDKDMNEKKSMNNHLHLLEAYSTLYRIWPDERLYRRLFELIEVLTQKIVDRTHRHFYHFFDERWTVRSRRYNYGHDIEASWLLCEAAGVLGDKTLRDSIQRLAVNIVQTVCAEGFDTDGGLFYEGQDGSVVDDNKDWWPQAEAMVGLINACQISGDGYFLKTAFRCWQFIESYMIDKENGEWFWRVARDGKPDLNEPKISEWKGPYHNMRACLQVLHRL
jgi:mannobiose 2-epimerase